MPMFGNQAQGGPGMGMSADNSSPGALAGGVVGNIFGLGGSGGRGTGGNPYNNFGMGEQPGMMPDHLARLQKQCMAGDGAACNQLQIAKAQWGDHQSQWAQQYGQNMDQYQQRTGRPMGMRKGW